jgi:hypothetical protein
VEKSASPPRPFPSHRGAFAFVSPIVLFPQPKKNQSFWGAAKETGILLLFLPSQLFSAFFAQNRMSSPKST